MKSVKYLLQLFIIFISFNNIYGQVPVKDEPHHKTVLLNNYVRLIDVHLKPHDTTMYHIHATPSVIVFISKSLMGTQDMSGIGLPSGEVLPGQTLFKDYAKDPITHRVYNSGDNVFHVMDIELEKNEPAADSCAALNNIQTTINEKLVRVYKFDLNKPGALNIPASSCAHLLICISGEVSAAKKKLKSGDFVFFDPNTTITVNGEQSDNSTCVLLELK